MVGTRGASPDALRQVDIARRPFNPQYVDHGDTIFQDLRNATKMDSFGLDLSRSLSQMLSEGFVDALPYLALILVVFLTSRIQQRQIQGRSSNAQVNPQQQAIMKIIPFMIPIISYGLPAAMVVYFLTGNLFRIGQQAYITRRFYHNRPEPVVASPSGTARAGDPVTAPRAAANQPSRRTGGGRVTPSSKPSNRTPSNGSTSSSSAKGGASSNVARSRRTTAGQTSPSKNKKKRS